MGVYVRHGTYLRNFKFVCLLFIFNVLNTLIDELMDMDSKIHCYGLIQELVQYLYKYGTRNIRFQLNYWNNAL